LKEIIQMDRRHEIIEALQKGAAETVAFFTSLAPEQLHMQIYQDGAQWTARQVLAHFVTIERSMQRLFSNILSGGQGSPENFDVDRFNLGQTRKLDGLDLPALLTQFQAVRRETIAMVAGMAASDLDREGRHAFHGQGRLERFIRWAYEHVQIHEDEMRKVMNLNRNR
jgi:DinB superfamily